MIFRRNVQHSDAQQQNGDVAQDGFSAQLTPGARRPWKMQQEEMQAAGAQPQTAYGVAGVRCMDLADNGDGTLTLVRCTDPEVVDLDIQFEAGACSVAAIAPRAFEGCAALRRVVLPPQLRMIGEMAFCGCASLERVEIPASVLRVGTLAFAKCQRLRRVRIEPGVQALGPSCFSKCTRLERVDIPASVASFGGGVFFGCGKQLTLFGADETPAAQYAKMNGVAFDSQRYKDDEELIFEENEDGTLSVMGARREAPRIVEIPSELCGRRISRIAERAFAGCVSLEQVIIGSGVREIGESAFCGCAGVISVALERGLERVGESAFAGCVSLGRITLPYGTASVGTMAFFGCTRLAFVKMPTTTRVYDLAFDGCAPELRVFGGVNAGRSMG